MMAGLGWPRWQRALAATGFLLQGLLIYRREVSGSLFAALLLAACALMTLAGVKGFRGLFAFSAALGGLGMALGDWLEAGLEAGFRTGAAHHHELTELSAVLLSWGGLFMIGGCGAACVLSPVPPAARPSSLLHHGLALAGMILGMLLPHALTGLGGFVLSPWALHLAMVAAMTLGGWLGFVVARRLGRDAPKRPGGG
jgi:hypothetical protein